MLTIKDAPIQPLIGTYSSVSEAPIEVWFNIFSFLTGQDQARAASICRKFRYVTATDPNSKLPDLRTVWRIAHATPTIQPLTLYAEQFFNQIPGGGSNYLLIDEEDSSPAKLLVAQTQTGGVRHIDIREALSAEEYLAEQKDRAYVLAATELSDTTIVTYSSRGWIDWWEMIHGESDGCTGPQSHCAAHVQPAIGEGKESIETRIADKKLYVGFQSGDGMKGDLFVVDLTTKRTVGQYEFPGEPCPKLSTIASNIIFSLEHHSNTQTLKATRLKDNNTSEVQWIRKWPQGVSHNSIEANDHWVIVGNCRPLSWTVFSASTGRRIWNYVDHPKRAEERHLLATTPSTVRLHKDFIIAQIKGGIQIWDIQEQRYFATLNTEAIQAYGTSGDAPLILRISPYEEELQVTFIQKGQVHIAHYKGGTDRPARKEAGKESSINAILAAMKRLAFSYLCGQEIEENK